MGLFDERKQMDILEKTQENLEQTQRNLDVINQLVTVRQDQTGFAVDEAEKRPVKIIEDIEQLQAAYALNLCTVSVTQIIDYMDLNIMEQEYDMILNNLNLQNMPDDDALLDILKQILNTVTFFKVDQKEREFVERDYRQKMINAVWSAIPNVGTLIAAGTSRGNIMKKINLAASVGTAYMSYRKQKAEIKNKYEKAMWKLEKSALEQFDGLKRELFDTAWRLAKHYQFDDKYRLTERQIHQYNAILMDTDNDRRYARLESIAENFEAYPVFWYQFGHTANLAAADARNLIAEKRRVLNEFGDNETDEYLVQEIKSLESEEEGYREKARHHFEHFQASNKYNLLREDKIASMCNLEYVELMLLEETKNKDLLICKLEEAAKFAGESLEVLQLCIFSYMRLERTDRAERYLKILVNEDYNRIMNAQILSSLYVRQFLDGADEDKDDANRKYSTLRKRVPVSYLFPWPEEADSNELEKKFLYHQKYSLLRKYASVLNEITRRYSVRFNKCIPQIYGIKYDEFSYEDTYGSRNRMYEQLMHFVKRDKKDTLRAKLLQEDIFESYTYVLQEYFYKLYELLEVIDNSLAKSEELREALLKPISEHQKEIEDFRSSMQHQNYSQQKIVNALFKQYTFMFFVEDMLLSYVNTVTENIRGMNMGGISRLEGSLLQFCIENNITAPGEDEKYFESENISSEFKSNFLFAQLIGSDEYKKLTEENALREKMINEVSKYCKENKLIKRNTKARLYVRGIDDNKLEDYLKTIKEAYNHLDVLVVIEDLEWHMIYKRTDLWIMTDSIGMAIEGKFSWFSRTPLKSVCFEKGIIKSKYGITEYSKAIDVDMDLLWGLIQKLLGEKENVNSKENHDIGNINFANQCIEVIDNDQYPKLQLNVCSSSPAKENSDKENQ